MAWFVRGWVVCDFLCVGSGSEFSAGDLVKFWCLHDRRGCVRFGRSEVWLSSRLFVATCLRRCTLIGARLPSLSFSRRTGGWCVSVTGKSRRSFRPFVFDDFDVWFSLCTIYSQRFCLRPDFFARASHWVPFANHDVVVLVLRGRQP